MNRVTITGTSGEVWWKTKYSIAASLGPWSLTAEQVGGTLTATVVSADTFRVSQQPLTFVVSRPNGLTWRWPIQSLQMAAGTLTASLGSQE